MRIITSGDDDAIDRSQGEFRQRGCITSLEGSRSCIRVRGLECYSPARIAVYRLLAIVKKCRGGKKVAVMEEREFEYNRNCGRNRRRRENGDIVVVEEEDVHRRRHSPERSSEDRRRDVLLSGCRNQEMTFNLAAGVGLLSLIAATKTELDKTVELRKQMEVFLESVKEEHQSKGTTTPKPSSEIGVAYAVSTNMDGLSNFSPYSFEDQIHAPTVTQPESGISLVCDKQCDMNENEGSVEGMNHLEEELAAELERLQLDVEIAGSSEAQEEVTEKSSMGNASENVSISYEEVIDPQDNGSPEHCGVPPLELERRLHELLESRQEERIKELEAHLECMKRKLQEKEVEVTWWKDTAKLISKQVPDSSKFVRGSL